MLLTEISENFNRRLTLLQFSAKRPSHKDTVYIFVCVFCICNQKSFNETYLHSYICTVVLYCMYRSSGVNFLVRQLGTFEVGRPSFQNKTTSNQFKDKNTFVTFKMCSFHNYYFTLFIRNGGRYSKIFNTIFTKQSVIYASAARALGFEQFVYLLHFIGDKK